MYSSPIPSALENTKRSVLSFESLSCSRLVPGHFVADRDITESEAAALHHGWHPSKECPIIQTASWLACGCRPFVHMAQGESGCTGQVLAQDRTGSSWIKEGRKPGRFRHAPASVRLCGRHGSPAIGWLARLLRGLGLAWEVLMAAAVCPPRLQASAVCHPSRGELVIISDDLQVSFVP